MKRTAVPFLLFKLYRSPAMQGNLSVKTGILRSNSMTNVAETQFLLLGALLATKK